MSTRCLIAVLCPEGSEATIQSIYCHHDGYPSGVGAILKEFYPRKADVERLFTLGDLSSLGETLDTCCAYHRDRGEQLKRPETWNNREELAHEAYHYCWAEYVYLHNGDGWEYCDTREKQWKQLDQ